MTDHDYDKEVSDELVEIEAERLRSQRFIQGTYATFALVALIAGVMFRFYYDLVGVDAAEGGFVGRAFLVLASANLLVLAVWEKIWQR